MKLFIEFLSVIIPLYTVLTPSPSTTTSALPLLRTQSPIILRSKFIIQWLNPLRLLPLTQLIRRCNLEETWSHFDQPLRFDASSIMHIFLAREHQGIVNNPFCLLAKKCRGRMEIHWGSFNK